MKNITLIGMPGSGKSTIGVMTAKAAGMDFIDVDLIIQKRENALLQQIVDRTTADEFIKKEGDAIMSITTQNTVIATGGSAVYATDAMEYLKGMSTVIYLKLPYRKIERRIHNIETRGILLKPGQTLFDVFKERTPLYQKYADFTVSCSGKKVRAIVEEILSICRKIDR